MNCGMIRRALAVAVGFIAVCFPVTAQQANRSAAAKPRTGTHQQLPANRSHPGSELSLYQPTIFSANDNSLLFRKGRVLTWSDGGRLASENALASTGMIALDLFSSAYLPPLNAFGPVPMNRGTTAPNSRPGNLGTDAKDSPEMMTSPPDRFYYGGEIGFMYGHWRAISLAGWATIISRSPPARRLRNGMDTQRASTHSSQDKYRCI